MPMALYKNVANLGDRWWGTEVGAATALVTFVIVTTMPLRLAARRIRDTNPWF